MTWLTSEGRGEGGHTNRSWLNLPPVLLRPWGLLRCPGRLGYDESAAHSHSNPNSLSPPPKRQRERQRVREKERQREKERWGEGERERERERERKRDRVREREREKRVREREREREREGVRGREKFQLGSGVYQIHFNRLTMRNREQA